MTAPPIAGDSAFDDWTLMLVEDDDADAMIVEELLLDAAYAFRMVRAVSVADACAQVTERTRCVLLDLGLPDSDGLSGLRRVLAAAPAAAVIVLTGLLDEHRGVEALAAGAQDYLVKGQVDGDLVVRAVRYALERKRNDEAGLQLRESEVRAEENARLERGLLPPPLLTDASLRHATTYRPGRHQALLGGDFYDVVQDDDGWLHVLMGDVMGHGPDEAALGVALRISWRALTLARVPETERLAGMQRILVSERRGDETFATVCTASISPDRRLLRMRLAGHPAPVVIGLGQLPDDEIGPALGIVDDPDPGPDMWLGVELDLPAGWSLLFVTDGLLEARDGSLGERLGWEGVLEEADVIVAHDGGVDPVPFVAQLLDRVETRNDGPLTDDVALLMLQHVTGPRPLIGPQPITGSQQPMTGPPQPVTGPPQPATGPAA